MKSLKGGMLLVYIFTGIAVLTLVGGGIYVLVFLAPALTVNVSSISNMRLLSRATMIYSFDNDDCLPNKSTWMDALTPYTPLKSMAFNSPSLAQASQNPNLFGLEMNQAFSSSSLNLSPPKKPTALFFEGKLTSANAFGPWTADLDARYNYEGQDAVPIVTGQLQYGYYFPKTNDFSILSGKSDS